jgi:thiol-disulfide isomerase/thioredoxin
MKIKKLLLLLVVASSLLLVPEVNGQTVLKQKNKTTDKTVEMVSIQGTIKDWKTRKLPSYIEFTENNIIKEDIITYVAKIDTEGKFSISFPKVYGQDIYVDYDKTYIIFVMPGDHITMHYDSENPNHPIDFTGDNAETNNNMIAYQKQQNAVKTNEYYDLLNNHIANDSCFVYKEYAKAEAIKDKAFLDDFLSKNTTTANFKNWAQNELKYELPNDLMRYRWLHFPRSKNAEKIELPDDYFDFIIEYPIKLEQEIISSSFQKYCHELQLMKSSKMYGTEMRFPSPFDIIAKLEVKNIKVDPKLKECLKLINAGEKQNAEEGEKLWADLCIKRNKEIQVIIDKIPLDIQEEYIKKYKKPELVELQLTAELYETIEKSDTLQLATIMPKKLPLIKTDSFRKFLSKKYQDFLADTRNTVDIEGVVLNNKNPSSGDSLLVNIINKHKGKVIYLDFWATWCGPCRAEMPFAKKLKDTLKDKEVVYVYLCGESPETNWKKLIDDLEIKGNHYFVNKNAWKELKNKFGVSGIPHYVLIDKNGVVVDKKADRPSSGAKIVNDILKLL